MLKIAEKTLSEELTDEIDNITQEDEILKQKIAVAKSKVEKGTDD